MDSAVTPASCARRSYSASSRIMLASSDASLIVAGRIVSIRTRLNRQGAGENHRSFAGIGVADFANAVVLLAAALQFGFHGAQVGGGDDQDHANPEIEDAQKLIALDLAELGEIRKDRQHGP